MKNNKDIALLFLIAFPVRKQLANPLFRLGLAGGVSVSCPLTTLSSVIRECGVQRIDLLKIDVEGRKMDVLAGLDECTGRWCINLTWRYRRLTRSMSPNSPTTWTRLASSTLRSKACSGRQQTRRSHPLSIFAVREAV